MNQFFDFDRFALLVAKHWTENKKRYLLSLLAFTGLLTGCFVISLVFQDDNMMEQEFQQTVYFFFLFTVGTFYASQYFRDLGSKTRGSNFLMTPASSFEKFLCGLLFVIILFFVVFTSVFYLVDTLMVNLANSLYNEANHREVEVVNIFHVALIEITESSEINLLLFYFAVQSAFLLGSAAFRKYSFIKTIIGLFLTWMFFALLTYFIYRQNAPDMDAPDLPGSYTQMLKVLTMYVIAPVLWLLTYSRLKNKQVAL